MKENNKRISVELGREEQDFLQRLGLASLLNSKYGPSVKMLWARLIENRTPIFFGAMLIFLGTTIVGAITVDRSAKAYYRLQSEHNQLKSQLAVLAKEPKIIVEIQSAPTGKLTTQTLEDTLLGRCDVNMRYGRHQSTILHFCANIGADIETITELVLMGADPNAQQNSVNSEGEIRPDSFSGYTPLMALIQNKKYSLALMYIQLEGIEVNTQTLTGRTALKMCLRLHKDRNKNLIVQDPDLEQLIAVLNKKTGIESQN